MSLLPKKHLDFKDMAEQSLQLGRLRGGLDLRERKSRKGTKALKRSTKRVLRDWQAPLSFLAGVLCTMLAVSMPIAYALAAALAIIYVVQVTWPRVTEWGISDRDRITEQREYYRILSSNLLHQSIRHLGCNLVALLEVGAEAEPIFGKVRTLLIFLAAGISSSLLSLFFVERSLGASGCIYGLLGACAAKQMRGTRRTIAPQMLRYVAEVVVNDVLDAREEDIGRIDFAGHAGGLVGGLLVGHAILESSKTRRRRR